MAKIVKKANGTGANQPKPGNPRDVAGAGFSKTFSPAESKEIEKQRRAMRQRLYAAG